jgi:hypothetical protein
VAAERVELIYEEHIRHLPVSDRLRLVELVARDLADQSAVGAKRSVLELRGLGKGIWENTDAQEYIDRLRGEWVKPE